MQLQRADPLFCITPFALFAAQLIQPLTVDFELPILVRSRLPHLWVLLQINAPLPCLCCDNKFDDLFLTRNVGLTVR